MLCEDERPEGRSNVLILAVGDRFTGFAMTHIGANRQAAGDQTEGTERTKATQVGAALFPLSHLSPELQAAASDAGRATVCSAEQDITECIEATQCTETTEMALEWVL